MIRSQLSEGVNLVEGSFVQSFIVKTGTKWRIQGGVVRPTPL